MSRTRKQIMMGISIVIFCFILCGNLPQASAVTVSIGETAIWEFTLPSFDPADFNLMIYYINGSAVDPGLDGFTGNISIYDTLSDDPLYTESLLDHALIFAEIWGAGVSNIDPVWGDLTDDATSFLTLELVDLLAIDGSWDSLNSADFSPYVILFGKTGVENLQVSGTLCSVPEPATMLLLGSGLIGLVGFRRKFKK